MEPVSSWRPFTELSSRARYLATRDMQNMLGGLPATAVTDEILQVLPGECVLGWRHAEHNHLSELSSHSRVMRSCWFPAKGCGACVDPQPTRSCCVCLCRRCDDRGEPRPVRHGVAAWRTVHKLAEGAVLPGICWRREDGSAARGRAARWACIQLGIKCVLLSILFQLLLPIGVTTAGSQFECV